MNRFAILGAMGIAVIVAALLLNYMINRDELGDNGSTPTSTAAIAPSGTSTGTAPSPSAGNAGPGGTGTATTTQGASGATTQGAATQGATSQGATTQGATSQGATSQGATTQGQAATNNGTAATGTAGAPATGASSGSAGQGAPPAATGGNSTASSTAAAPVAGTGGNSATDQASTGATATAAAPASTAPAGSTSASSGTPPSSGTTAGAGNATVATTESTNQGGAATANGNNADTAGTAAAAPPPPPVIRPSFDVVRVNPDGSTIIAGRAAPHSTVTITADGQKAATVVADDRGEWVILPPDKLAPGNHQIGITSVLGGAPPVPSDDVVVVVVPQPQVASTTTTAAGGTQTATAVAPQQPLAVVVPRTDQGSTVLQSPNPPQSGQLILESVDYDSKGRVVIGGRAGPGKEVRAYLDNGLMGMTRADSSGRWHITPDKPVLPGLHTLRIDEVDDAGKVLARVESPFSRAEPLSIGAGDQVVVVQPGNNLWLIATRTYGSGPRYTVIYQANKSQIKNPDLIYPGQVFKLPTATP